MVERERATKKSDALALRCPLIFWERCCFLASQELAFSNLSRAVVLVFHAPRRQHDALDAPARRASEKSECCPLAEVSGDVSLISLGHQGFSAILQLLLSLQNPPSLFLPLTKSGGRGVGRVGLRDDGVGHGGHR